MLFLWVYLWRVLLNNLEPSLINVENLLGEVSTVEGYLFYSSQLGYLNIYLFHLAFLTFYACRGEIINHYRLHLRY